MERTGLLICIGLLGYFHGISAAALGAACTADADCTAPATADTKCQNSVCRLLATKSCTGNTDKCVANAECGTGSLCVCKTGYAASAANLCLASLGTTCAAVADCDTTTVTGTICDTQVSAPVCAIGAGSSCTGQTTKCVSGATCSTVGTLCSCNTGYKRLFENTCYLCSGTAGVVASVALIFALLGTAVF
ncbi:multiple epidermal growth factor-like domains protein 11 [Dreissena polymorpha]|uniref:Uncharacterized protein n=1 Tax=Dreissena polymorpha TaxID=45954 RepID=A0A9D4L8M6_DREPO|nr:multiple epidermal growth factor-like domains protein 11 [Dreissena polymorpha]KAH3853596.1 hypothetical protein DPMN_096125 [Dreissena polymorpha]